MKTLLKSFVLFMATGDALAWRCNVWVIEPYQTLYEVGQKCGEPQFSENRTEWRLQISYQQQCQNITEPVTQPAPQAPPARGTVQPPPQPQVTYQTRTICDTVPFYINVPVDVTILYYNDNVPKALHFENGRLQWIEDLWNMRH